MQMETLVRHLDSGIGYVFKKISSPVAYCALTIRAGTRDEEPRLNGVAHLTEHMLFKGTNKRGARRINNFLERLGGELNAYTTKEETVIHATVLKEDIGKAVELLSDLAFNSKFPEKELAKEIEVVIDEIASYKDTPSEQIFDDFDQYLFRDHPLAKPILGSPKSVRAIGLKEIKEFTTRYYRPSNMTFSIVADISESRGESLVNRHFGAELVKGSEGLDGESNRGVLPTTLPLPQELRINRKTHQAHAVIGAPTYDLYSSNRVALALLTNYLGGPALNSRLNQSLREKHGLVYTVDASYTPYTDTGLFTIYFGCDKSNLDRCLALLDKELKEVRERGISPANLKASKKQLMGQLAIANDNAEAQCLTMGKSLLFLNRVESIEQIRERVDSIDSTLICGIANQLLDRERMFTLIYS